MSRVSPLEPPFDPDVDLMLRQMMPPDTAPIALFRMFGKNLPMMRAMSPWGRYELGRDLALNRRDREIVIDRTCARSGCEYEWGVHVSYFAARVGLTDAQVSSLTHGQSTDACWSSERDRLLIEAVDALHDTSDLPDDLWTALSGVFDEPQLLDLIVLIGWYHAISYVARATRLPNEPNAPTFAMVAQHRPGV